ncbi:MAG: ABC transporter ATP-binding protein [bacterium]|nr:ABC transporter ATP-binding protein [bacterium]
MNANPSVGLPTEGTALELVDVHKSYRTGQAEEVQALRGVDLCIRRSEMVAVMGPSGSGKTTLMEILGCLSQPTSGSYRLFDCDVDGMDPDGLARLRGREIGFIFQSFHLLPRLDLAENVELPLFYQRVPRAERRKRALRVLERVGLDHRASHRPGEISGGERQRAAIARALVNEPSLVLADEPTGNLDTDRGQEILAMLESVHAGGATVVIVTHDPSIGGRAPRRVLIRDGLLVGDERQAS